jgi:hypothetical protein
MGMMPWLDVSVERLIALNNPASTSVGQLLFVAAQQKLH